MTRSTRLTAAILLLAIAALLFMMRDTAVNQAIMLPLVALFATPGLALLAWGIVPSKGLPAQTTMAFKPATLVIGLLVSVIGVGLIYLHQIIHVAPHFLLIGALLAVPGGLIYAGNCWTECCAKCLAPIDDRRIMFDASRADVEAAIKSGSAMRMLELQPRLASVPRSAPATARTPAVAVDLQCCPKCMKFAALSGPGGVSATLTGDPAARIVRHFQPA